MAPSLPDSDPPAAVDDIRALLVALTKDVYSILHLA